MCERLIQRPRLSPHAVGFNLSTCSANPWLSMGCQWVVNGLSMGCQWVVNGFLALFNGLSWRLQLAIHSWHSAQILCSLRWGTSVTSRRSVRHGKRVLKVAYLLVNIMRSFMCRIFIPLAYFDLFDCTALSMVDSCCLLLVF